MSRDVTASIRALLDQHGVVFKEIEHEPTHTSEESAKVRGEPLEVGAKALVMRLGEDYGVFVLPADRKVDSGAIKRHLGLKGLRFATPEELLASTGLVPGSVPPFGHPILPMRLFADPEVGPPGVASPSMPARSRGRSCSTPPIGVAWLRRKSSGLPARATRSCSARSRAVAGCRDAEARHARLTAWRIAPLTIEARHGSRVARECGMVGE
jgi:Ala-tRNA(Pro) deacylase